MRPARSACSTAGWGRASGLSPSRASASACATATAWAAALRPRCRHAAAAQELRAPDGGVCARCRRVARLADAAGDRRRAGAGCTRMLLDKAAKHGERVRIWASSTMPICRRCTGRPRCSPSRPSTRASGCRCWRRWPAACRSSASNASSLPEVAGDAALLVDPLETATPGGRHCARVGGLQAAPGHGGQRAGAGRSLHVGRAARQLLSCFAGLDSA